MSDSPRHGLHVNSLVGFSIKTKVEIESTLEKQKFWISVSFSIKFHLEVHKQVERFELTSDRVLVFTCCSMYNGKNEG